MSWFFCYSYFKLSYLYSLINKNNGDCAWPHGLISLPAWFICSSYSSFSVIMTVCPSDRCSLLLMWWLGWKIPSSHPSIHPLSSGWINRFVASIYQGTLLSIVRLPRGKKQVLSSLKDLRVQKGRKIRYIINYSKIYKIVKCH